jgi:hypothetical protein
MTITTYIRVPVTVVAVACACTSLPAMPTSISDEPGVAPSASSGTQPSRGPAAPVVGRPPLRIPGAHVPGIDGGTAPDGSADVGAPDAVTHVDAGPPAPGTWQPLVNTPPFATGVPLLLTDGTIMVHGLDDGTTWWRLTPDATGSYINGTWSELAPMPSGYQPMFFSSAVLADGRVVVIGGEYNADVMIETTLGAIYDPVANLWTPIAAPTGWGAVGDAPSVVLADGTLMIGSSESPSESLFNAKTLSWSPTGGNKADPNSEEGWTLLPSGKVLTVDIMKIKNSEVYDPSTGSWTSAGNTGVALAAPAPTYEIGPAVLMADGTVFATGATGQTAVYGTDGTWTLGPSFPMAPAGQLDIADGPAVLLPNGHALCATSVGAYNFGAYFFEYDGTALNPVASTPNAVNESSYTVYLFLLPSGQVIATDGSPDVEVYTPGGGPDPSWAPTITTAPTTVVRGTTYPIHGTQLNGLSQAVFYGDDYQAATNYPLVRITNDATGNVAYGRTHDHSTMGVATGSADVSTLFEAPSSVPVGPSHLVVVANGIASLPVAVTIQ